MTYAFPGNHVLHLSSGSMLATAVDAAVRTLDDGTPLPATLNGIPCFYFWRQSVKVGELSHPVQGWKLAVTEPRLNQWKDNANTFLKNGNPIPIYSTHNPKNDPALKLGNVLATRVRDGWIEELHQYLGEEEKTLALKNYVSIGLEKSWRDSGGRQYGELIRHSAIVPDPVQHGQGPAIAASIGEPMDLTLTPAQIAALTLALGLPADTNATNFAERVTSRVASLSGELATAKTLSIGSLPADALAALAEADEANLETLVATGKVTPACGAALKAALIRDAANQPIQLSLSGGGKVGSRLSKAVIEALKQNTSAVAGGSATGVQLSVGNPAVNDGPADAAAAAAAKAENDAWLKARAAGISHR